VNISLTRRSSASNRSEPGRAEMLSLEMSQDSGQSFQLSFLALPTHLNVLTLIWLHL